MDKLKKYKPLFFHPYSKILFGILPCVFSLLFFFSKNTKIENLKQESLFLKKKNERIKLSKEKDDRLLEKLKGADRNYVQKELESCVFLQSEINHLETILPSDRNNKSYIDRLSFLKNGQNCLHFREQNFKQRGKFQEVELVQLHPVEITTEDLEMLLYKLEEAPGSPYFVIKNIELIRKTSSDRETYLLSLELIKYEMSYET